MKRAVFLDRDGTIIEDHAYNDRADAVVLLPGAGAALARLHAAGYQLVLVTNQSGIGRGYFGRDVVEAQHARLAALLANAGVALAAVKYCPHTPADGCACRKPAPGMLLTAAADLGVDPAASWMVGDKHSDVEAGRRAGCQTVLIDPAPDTAADHTAPSLAAAADTILAHHEPT